MGANLASVHNVYEYRRIQAMIRAGSCSCREAWLGGSDAQQVFLLVHFIVYFVKP